MYWDALMMHFALKFSATKTSQKNQVFFHRAIFKVKALSEQSLKTRKNLPSILVTNPFFLHFMGDCESVVQKFKYQSSRAWMHCYHSFKAPFFQLCQFNGLENSMREF